MVSESTTKHRAGVFGASGTTGVELMRILERHPAVDVAFATSRSGAGKRLHEFDAAAPPAILQDPAEVQVREVDVVFTCLPHGHSAAFAEKCFAAGVFVVDLSGDLRLETAAHARVYGTPRSESLASQAVYGLTELFRARVQGARVVSNPGCYPTCVALGLAPLARAGLLRAPIVVSAMSGVSGAGREATATTHFCSVYGDVRPYKPGRSHRHVAEMEQTLARCAPEGASLSTVTFCPHLVPLERGMLATMVTDIGDHSLDEVRGLYETSYGGERFVEVLPNGEPARVRQAAGTNRAIIGIHEVEETSQIMITSAIDNLVKGAAGQAVQNMNLMMDLPESLGLLG